MRGLLFSLRVMGSQTKKRVSTALFSCHGCSLTFFVQFMLFSAKMS